MNQALLARIAQPKQYPHIPPSFPPRRRHPGMSGLGIDWGLPVTGMPPLPPTTTTPTSSSSSNNAPWWGSILGQLPSTVASIWNVYTVSGSPYGSNAMYLQPGYYDALAAQNQNQNNLTQAQLQALLASRSSSSGLTGDGINLFGTQIGWGAIVLVLAAFFLLQSKPYPGRR